MSEIILIASLITAGVAATVIVHHVMWRRYSYLCPKCGEVFKPERYFESLFAVNWFDERKMRCPKCETKDYMQMLKDKA